MIIADETMGIFEGIFGGIFSSSGTIRKVPIYTLRRQIVQWSKYRSYPSYYELPPAITFPSDFWTRIQEIYRHTTGDNHERAITVWWADGEFVLTENVRGKEQEVLIPKQRVAVRYQPVKGTKRAERIVEVNGKLYRKRSVDIEQLRRIKAIEVQFLFNMHTHPPHENLADTNSPHYSFFSLVDIRSFLASSACVTGVVTDVLWLLAKTDRTPAGVPDAVKDPINAEMLTKEAGLKVYRAEFGKSAVVVRPDSPGEDV